MKLLYLECNMGAAGDMLLGALLECCPDPQKMLEKLNSLGLPGVEYHLEKTEKCGVTGTHVHVHVHGQEEGHGHHHHPHDGPESAHHHHGPEHPHEHEHHHHHSSYPEILEKIASLPMPEQARRDAAAVYRLIGDAESLAHGRPIEQIHFHEVGTLDALADVAGCCYVLHELAPDRIEASPITVGSGTVHCAHGILPVPAPATAAILKGIPFRAGEIAGELCTPTGAALLRHFVKSFGPMPLMVPENIGYGMGTRDFPAANCVRAFFGESGQDGADEIAELCCNLDDMTPEAVGYAADLLFARGALDVFLTPIQMKKFRPAVLLTCLCEPEREEEFSTLMLQVTTTLGVRRRYCSRRKLTPRFETRDGIRVKISEGYGVRREKPEYDDVVRQAENTVCSYGELAEKWKKD